MYVEYNAEVYSNIYVHRV